jgi:hypothetical protein
VELAEPCRRGQDEALGLAPRVNPKEDEAEEEGDLDDPGCFLAVAEEEVEAELLRLPVLLCIEPMGLSANGHDCEVELAEPCRRGQDEALGLAPRVNPKEDEAEEAEEDDLDDPGCFLAAAEEEEVEAELLRLPVLLCIEPMGLSANGHDCEVAELSKDDDDEALGLAPRVNLREDEAEEAEEDDLDDPCCCCCCCSFFLAAVEEEAEAELLLLPVLLCIEPMGLSANGHDCEVDKKEPSDEEEDAVLAAAFVLLAAREPSSDNRPRGSASPPLLVCCFSMGGMAAASRMLPARCFCIACTACVGGGGTL